MLFNFPKVDIMSAINRQPKNATREEFYFDCWRNNHHGVMLLFAYLMWHVTLEENMKWVKIIAITEARCIVKTLYDFVANIGDCQT